MPPRPQRYLVPLMAAPRIIQARGARSAGARPSGGAARASCCVSRRIGDALTVLPLEDGVIAAIGDDDARNDAEYDGGARRQRLGELDGSTRREEALLQIAQAFGIEPVDAEF